MKEITAKEAIIAAALSCIAVLAGVYVSMGSAFSLQHHSALKNVVFSNITFMGDAVFAFAAAAALLFFFNKKDAGMRLLLATFITIALVQIFKNLTSGGRELQLYFEGNAYYFDDALSIPSNIISSHTAIAFTLAAFFSSMSGRKINGIFLFAAAALVAYTRIYTAHESLAALALGIVPAACSSLAVELIMRRREKLARPKSRRHSKSAAESLSYY